MHDGQGQEVRAVSVRVSMGVYVAMQRNTVSILACTRFLRCLIGTIEPVSVDDVWEICWRGMRVVDEDEVWCGFVGKRDGPYNDTHSSKVSSRSI